MSMISIIEPTKIDLTYRHIIINSLVKKNIIYQEKGNDIFAVVSYSKIDFIANDENVYDININCSEFEKEAMVNLVNYIKTEVSKVIANQLVTKLKKNNYIVASESNNKIVLHSLY